MEIASNKGVIADASTPAGRAGMSESEWREAIKFDSTDTGWVIMSIGMAIGAGIVFLPVQVGLMGLWVFLLSSVIGYPAMYLFQRLFINTLAESPECKDYPSVISGYLGKNWGILLGALYFVMLVIWMFVYSTAITNDSASYLHTFGVTEGLLSDSPFYGLVLICILVAISSRGEKLLFKISTGMVLTKLLVVAALGVSMVGMWHLYNVGSLPPLGLLVKNAIITLPFTLTSILFIQTLSPMVISYRSREKSIEVARHKALRAMNIAFGILFVTVFFYAVSFTLAMGHDEAVKAYEQNISALAKDLSSSIVIRTSAASDARMGGATLPAMSNSGSGNQGITATMPVVVVAEHFGADDERLARALMLSHLSAIYIHNQLPRLSALCAATTAAMGAAAGMAWLVDGRYETISMAISSMIGDVSGMICDGASNSCAMKVSTSASAAWKAVLMALDDTAVTGNEGIVAHDVEQSIANLCALASHSMQQTDRQIIEIMASKAR